VDIDRSDVELCEMVVKSFPALRPLFDEHLRDYDELLPHVFFGDISRWVEKMLVKRGHERTLQRFFVELETIYGKDDRAENVIAASLLENLWDHPEVRTYLGPKLQKQFNRSARP
jgi:hypothetical protein